MVAKPSFSTTLYVALENWIVDEGGVPRMVSVETLAGPSLEEGGSAFRPGGISPNTMVLPAAVDAALMLTKKVWADWLAWKVNWPAAGEKSVPATAVPPMAGQPTGLTGAARWAWRGTGPAAGEKAVPATAVPPMADQPTVMTVPAPLVRVTTMGLDW